MDMLKIDWPVSLKLSVENTETFPTAHCPYPLSVEAKASSMLLWWLNTDFRAAYMSVLKINRILVKTETMMIKAEA